jgi:hypothetical protein
MKYLLFLTLSFVLVGCSCSKKELPKTYSKRDIMFMVFEGDKEAREILPTDMSAGIKCTDYRPGCRSARMARVLDMEVIFVEFDSEEDARLDAIRLKGLYTRNWLLDDVGGEPVLERFFKKYLKAKKPGEENKESSPSEEE